MTPEQRIAVRQIESWARAGGRDRAEPAPRLVLLDGTAFLPVTPAHREAGPAAPLARVVARVRGHAPDGLPPPAVAIVAADPDDAEALAECLRAAEGVPPLRRAAGPGAWEPAAAGELLLVEGATAGAAAEAAAGLDGAWRVLAWLSPATPADLPARALHALARREGAELLCRLPLEELRRLERHGATPVADLPVHVRRYAEGVSAMLADPRFEWLGRWRAMRAAEGAEAAREAVAERVRARLAGASPAATVARWAVPGAAAGGADTLDWLLATHAPARVLEVNRVLHELRARGVLPRVEPTDPAVRLEDPGLLDLFGGGAPGAAPPGGGPIRVVDLPALAERAAAAGEAGAATLADVVRHLLGPDLHPEDVRAALRLLRLQRRVSFRSLADPDAPLRWGDPGAPAPRRRREGGAPTLWGSVPEAE